MDEFQSWIEQVRRTERRWNRAAVLLAVVIVCLSIGWAAMQVGCDDERPRSPETPGSWIEDATWPRS